MNQSYREFTKYQGCVPDANVGFISGSKLSIRRLTRPIDMSLGKLYQTCPILELRDSSTTMYMLESGTLKINLDFYIRLVVDDEDDDSLDVRSNVLIELYQGSNVIRRIRETLSSPGIHRISIHEYIPVIQYDILRFRLLATSIDSEAYYYNVESDVYTAGTVRLL